MQNVGRKPVLHFWNTDAAHMKLWVNPLPQPEATITKRNWAHQANRATKAHSVHRSVSKGCQNYLIQLQDATLCPCQCSMRASLLSCSTSSDCLLFISRTLHDSAQSNKSFYTSERVKVGSWAKTCVIWKVDILLVWTLAMLSALCKFPSLFYLCSSIGSHGTAARLSWAENPRYAQPRTPAVGTVMKH